MKHHIISVILFSFMALSINLSHAQTKMITKGQRRYDLIVNQGNDTVKFNRSLRELRGNSNRAILTDIFSSYLTLGASTLTSATQNLVGAGIAYIQEAARDKRPDWENATMGECKFTKHLPMQTEILDFYGKTSTRGAMDPEGMLFSGFGCRQYITVIDDDGNTHDEEVFYLSCGLKDDDEGTARMLNHSKFEVVVDELRFNPYLCNLPNDTLSTTPATMIGFDFNKRKNLEFNVVATIKSSWMNEAIQVFNDEVLGKFVITAKIDSDKIDDDNIFRYSRENPEDSAKVVVVFGDSFLVPRSYAGYAGNDKINTWGTGQYKVEMDISESCIINRDYYTYKVDGKEKWNDEWKDEWKKMKKRPKQKSGQNFVEMIFPSFSGNNWITTVIEPTATILLEQEGKYINAASAAALK